MKSTFLLAATLFLSAATLFLSAATLFLSAPTLAQDTAVKSAIQKQYEKEAAALARKDVTGMLSINTNDYTVTNRKGTILKREALQDQLNQVIAMAQTSKVTTQIEKMTVKGDTATVIASDRSVIVLLNPQTKAKMTLEGTSRNEDTWVKQKGTWLRKKNRVLSNKNLLDGKPIEG